MPTGCHANTFWYDRQGVIRYKWAGSPGEKVMDAALEKVIKAAEEDHKKKMPK